MRDKKTKRTKKNVKVEKRVSSYFNYLPLLLIMLALIGTYILSSEPTGYVTLVAQHSYTDTVGVHVEGNYSYQWVPKNSGQISSLRLNGQFSPGGVAKVYLEFENEK